jgi:tetratricopeptide (TPR) repeat protein
VVFRQREKLIKTLICIGIVAATLVAYEPIRHNSFVSYDDYAYITENPNVTGGLTLESVIWAFTRAHMGNWHPLTLLSHILDYQLFGSNPVGPHVVNLLFHITNALLLFGILTNLTGATWPSAFVAAIFALHPVHVESVAWAAERKDVLSGLFWMLTMAAYIRYARRPGKGRYVLLLLVYGLCIMTKPVVVTLPLVLLLLDYWPLGRLQQNQPVKATPKVSLARLIKEKIPLLALSAFLSVMTLIAQKGGGAVAPLEKWPLDYRVGNVFLSYIRYIGETLWPSRLAVFYPQSRSNLQIGAGVFCALLFVLASVLAIYTGRRRKYIAVGWLWYVGTLVPMIGLVQTGAQAMADRYMYIPMLGLLIIIAWAVKDFVVNRPHWKIVAAVLAVAALLSSLILTRIQVRYWENNLTLYGHALKVTKNNAVMENNYGCALSDANQLDEAMLHLKNALRIAPAYPTARCNLGSNLLKQGKLDEAIACFNKLIKNKQDNADVHYNLAVALGTQKKYDEAIKHFDKALELNPKHPNAHNKIGIVLLATGRTKEAITHLNEALKTNADRMDVYVNLATAYSQSGNYEQAIQNRNKAMELKSDNPEVLNNLAWLLATGREISANDANKAIGFAQRACELTGYKAPTMLDTLAAAYAAAGRFNEAMTTAEQAINTAKTQGRKDLADEIQNRTELYKAGQRYIQK